VLGQGETFVDNPRGIGRGRNFRIECRSTSVRSRTDIISAPVVVVRALVISHVVRKPSFPELRLVKTCKDGAPQIHETDAFFLAASANA
jgi:hypothetical protein